MGCGKVPYTNKKTALAMAAQYSQNKDGIVYRVYWCHECEAYNLTTDGKFKKKVASKPLQIEIKQIEKQFSKDVPNKVKVRKMRRF